MNWLRDLLLPAQGSAYAGEIDKLFLFITLLSAFFFLLIAALTGWFVWRYRRARVAAPSSTVTHSLALELTWTLIPLAIVTGIFFWSFNQYVAASVAPGDAMEIQVTAKKWLWTFEYPNGTRTINEIHIPLGKPVKFVMSSEDVIHSFYVPSMRLKQDVLPNRYTELWFTPTAAGMHTLLCAEYCGRSHSDMLGRIWVDNDAAYQKWLEEGDESTRSMPLKELGKMIYESRGCSTCHSIDGSRGQGPSFTGVFGHEIKLADGKTVQGDANYIRESILQPQAKIVAGYEGIMPTFQGLLREREIVALIEFIKSLK
ncbi:MAG: cytochrome c oxidase subunit II [Acidobacteria bacterium]|nr:cytochrome c oxidase subunit II [Acidobacteriota bacterium]